MATKEKTKSSVKLSRAHIFFLVAGLLLLVRFLVNGGVPSLNDPLKFVVGIFELILIIGFYVFFLVGAKNCSGTLRAFAPALLLIIIDGQYSSVAGNNAASNVINSIAKMAYLLIIVCGFVFLFIHHKLVGMVFAYGSFVYGLFILVSYIVTAIMDGVNGTFSWQAMLDAMLLFFGFALVFAGSYLTTKNKDWSI